MPRTTVDVDATVLKELKAQARREGKSLGALISELAAQGLKAGEASGKKQRVSWKSRSMSLKVDLRDKDALYDLLEGD